MNLKQKRKEKDPKRSIGQNPFKSSTSQTVIVALLAIAFCLMTYVFFLLYKDFKGVIGVMTHEALHFLILINDEPKFIAFWLMLVVTLAASKLCYAGLINKINSASSEVFI